MPHQFKGQRTLMRIFIGESDRSLSGAAKGRPLYQALLELLRERDFAGATVLRGVAGFGAQGRMRTDALLRLSLDLPVIVEVVATEEQIRAVLPDLDRMIDGGLITLEPVRVIMYRPHDVEEDRRWLHRIEGLEPVE